MKKLTFLFLFLSFSSFAQTSSVSKIIDQIDYQNDTILAVFNWVTDNIKYDVRKAKQMESGINFYKKGNFKSREEYRAHKLKNVITKKKGVCEDYSLLFHSIVTELGYTAFKVSGITKNKKGKMNNSLGHAWNAVKVNGSWKLYDLTWGAGYVHENRKFIKKYFKEWYDVDPKYMLERHFPFDPIWQLSEEPLSFDEFKKGTTARSGIKMNFNRMIENFLQKGSKDRALGELERLQQNKSNFKLIRKRIDYLKREENNSKAPDIFKGSNANYAVFSKYMNEGKNKRFKGKKWTKEYALEALLDLEISTNASIEALKTIKPKDRNNKKSVKNAINQSKKLLSSVKKEIELLKS